MEHILQQGFWTNGPRPDSLYNFPGQKTVPTHDERSRTLQPIVTGTSVVGLCCKDFVILGADTLGSYGSLSRYKDVPRLKKVNDKTVVGAGGDIADFQYISELIDSRVLEDECFDDGHQFSPKSLHSWLTRILYNRRTKMNPLWNVLVVGGMDKDNTPFLGYVDKIGTAFKDPTIATGFGAYLALPILREHYKPDMSLEEGQKVVEECLKVLYYRDCRTINRYQVSVITKDGVKMYDPAAVPTDWGIAHSVAGYE